MNIVVEVSFRGPGFFFALIQLPRSDLAAGVVLVAGGGKEKKQGETQVTGVSVCKYLGSESIEIY